MPHNASDIATVFIWRGGLRHWSAFDEPRFVVQPASADFIGPAPRPGARLRLVDTHAFSGVTLARTAAALRRAGYVIEGMHADIANERIADVHALPRPRPEPPLISVSGLAGSGKSALAWALAEAAGATHVRWARFVDAPGLYGEAAALAEAADPLVFAKRALPALDACHGPVVLDGVKDADALTFLAFASRRPLIPLFVTLPEAQRQAVIVARGDGDDQFDAQRTVLFADRLARLRQQCIEVRLDGFDHSEAVEALRMNGIEIPMPFYTTLLDKRAAVWIPLYAATHAGKGKLPGFPPELVFHTSYSDGLGVSGDLAHRVNVVASAMRIIDDIVDEHDSRRLRRSGGKVEYIPAVWRTTSPWQAIMHAASMLAWAGRVVDDPGYAPMIRRVAEATLIELQADLERRPLTPAEYERSLDKEIAFREWLAGLVGQDIEAARRKAIEAQRANDQHAAGLEAVRLKEVV